MNFHSSAIGTTVCRTLYEPRNAWVFARRVKGLYSVRDFHHGMELHARDFGWRFFGVQMTVSVFCAISGGMVTLIGVLAAASFDQWRFERTQEENKFDIEMNYHSLKSMEGWYCMHSKTTTSIFKIKRTTCKIK